MKLKPIKDKKKIAVFFEKGRVIKGDNMFLRVYKFDDEEGGCVVSVPKKKISKAVDRNLIKRRMRACLVKIRLPENALSFFLIYSATNIISSDRMLNELTELFKK